MLDKATKAQYIRLYMESEVLGKFTLCLFDGDDSIECYLLQKGYPMRYMFGLLKDTRINDVVACCMRNILDYWQFD